MLEFVDESVTGVVDQQTTDTTQGFGSEELDLGVGVLRVDKTCGVDLNFFEIDTLGTDRHGHLVSVTGTVVAVGGGLGVSCGKTNNLRSAHQVVVLRSVLFEQRVGSEICGVTSGSEDDRSVFSVLLAVLLVLDTDDLVAILEDLADFGLFKNLDSVRGVLCEIFKLDISLYLL